jgi:hypothetical protein
MTFFHSWASASRRCHFHRHSGIQNRTGSPYSCTGLVSVSAFFFFSVPDSLDARQSGNLAFKNRNTYTPHIHIASKGLEYTLHVHIASVERGYTLHIHTAGGGRGYTLHVHTAGSGRDCWLWKRIRQACPYCWRWKGIHPACPYCWRWKGLLAVEKDTPGTSILLAEEGGTPCTVHNLHSAHPCCWCWWW